MSTNLTVTFSANHILFNKLTKYITYRRYYEDEEVQTDSRLHDIN